MEKLIEYLTERMASLVLSFALLSAAFFPCLAQADGEFMLDRGDLDRIEGDPLDGNEPDSDPTGGDDIHDTSGALDSERDFFNLILQSTRVLLVPQYNGSTLTFKIIFLAEAIDAVER